MKAIIRAVVQVSCAIAFAVLLALSSANAQQTRRGKLQIESLDRLAPTAAESVNVNLDESLLKIVPPILKDEDKDDKKIKDVIFGLKGVYVRRFEFDREGGYSESDVAPIREQLRAPGWQRIVEVRSRREDKKNIEVYLMTDGNGRIEGLALLSVEPKELTVINIVGSIDLEKLSQLQGSFDIPDLDLERDEDRKPPKKNNDAPKPSAAPVLQKP